MKGSRNTPVSTTARRARRILNAPGHTPAVLNEPHVMTIKQASNELVVAGRCESKPELPSCTDTLPKKRELLKRTVRRRQLREMVPLADTTIYEMEQRGEFPRRFYLTPRCAVWDAYEVEAWIEERRRASSAHLIELAPRPDVRKRSSRPVRR
jgi:prophage regulatory protein